MTEATPPRAHLIFTGSGPILVLSTFPKLTDERLLGKLRYKGIDKFIAYEVDLAAVKKRYPSSYANVAEDHDGAPVFLARSAWNLTCTEEDWPDLRFKKTREQSR